MNSLKSTDGPHSSGNHESPSPNGKKKKKRSKIKQFESLQRPLSPKRNEDHGTYATEYTKVGLLPPRAKSTNAKPSVSQKLVHTNPPGSSVTPGNRFIQQFRGLNIGHQSGKRNVTPTPSGKKNPSSPSGKALQIKKSQHSDLQMRVCKNLQDVATLIKSSSVHNIIVMCGAGISTASGIPDFRSPKIGLYHNLQNYNVPHPEAIFDLEYFLGNPRPFYTLAKDLYPGGRYVPNYIHHFLRLLNDKELLLRVYTQNIDGLERMAGLPSDKLVEAHGNFLTASCTLCKQKFNGELVRQIIMASKMPRCENTRCFGLVKPDIVFFGEDLPKKFYYYLKDFPQADLVLVMGTSLKVEPFAGIINNTKLMVPRVLFNMEAVGTFASKPRTNDLIMQGDIIASMKYFVSLLGWEEDMRITAEKITKQGNIITRLFEKKGGAEPLVIPIDLSSERKSKKKAVVPETPHTSTKKYASTVVYSKKITNWSNNSVHQYEYPDWQTLIKPRQMSAKSMSTSHMPPHDKLLLSRPMAFHAQAAMSRSFKAHQEYVMKPKLFTGLLIDSSSDASSSDSSSTNSYSKE